MALNLQNLPNGQPIATADGRPTLAFTVYWQQVLEAIEQAFNDLADQVAAIAAAQAAAAAAQATANAAQLDADAAATAAAAAQGMIADVATSASHAGSYVDGLVLTGRDVGASATVGISAHNRSYPQTDGSTITVAVNLGDILGLGYSTTYYVYYDQASRAGGAVSYVATLNRATAAQVGIRHFVGMVTTPALGGADTIGEGPQPPGVGST